MITNRVDSIAESEGRVLRASVEMDDILKLACQPFDYHFTGESTFTIPRFDSRVRDESWSIGLIVGPSGSGKTQLLRKYFGESQEPEWNRNKAVVSHFLDHQDATMRLTGVGLNSIPSWCRPYHVLSTGEQFRARMARMLNSNVTFDEFTSVVDRTVAKSCCWAIQRMIRDKKMTGVVFASCHYDITEWLQPDWVFDMLTQSMLPRGCLQRRPPITIDIIRCERDWWEVFKKHHYLSGNLNQSCRCWLAMWGKQPVGFGAALSMPSGVLKNAWRGHRTVVLPDYQGLGIGVRLSDAIGQIFKDEGMRYYSKTAHPRMGEYRNRSPLWRPTTSNQKAIKETGSNTRADLNKAIRIDKVCYSHEYIGKVEKTSSEIRDEKI